MSDSSRPVPFAQAKLQLPMQVPPISDREKRLREFDRAVWVRR